MAIRFEPYSADRAAAARELNQRIRRAAAPTDFLLPEEAPAEGVQGVIARRHLLALDGEQVRGGLLEWEQPAWLAGAPTIAFNYQSPLSEGVADRRFGMVGLALVRYMQQDGRRAYAVGMGGEHNPLPRLLKAAGWSVRPAPFFYRVIRPRRVLTEIGPLRAPPWRPLAARAAAWSGLGWAAVQALQARRLTARTRGCAMDPVESWGEWADGLWQEFRLDCSFAVTRDRRTLKALYPLSDPKLLRFVLRRNDDVVGWSVCYLTAMQESRHFGDLRVGSILDSVSRADCREAAVALTVQELKRLGAELVVSNQTHARWRRAFRRAGFLSGASNYLVATSPALSEAIAAQPAGEESIHVTRGDGDGRIHL